MRKIMNDEQESFLKENYMRFTYVEMSNMDLFKPLTSKQIRNRARNMGLRKERQFDERFFQDVNSAQKAYFLGLMYADGYVVDDGEIGIELIYSDKPILEDYNKAIGDAHKIKERKRRKVFNGHSFTSHTATLRIYSKNMASDLINQGVVPRKTYSNIHPEIKGDLFFHFLRGYFDGDGCVYKHNKKGYNMVHFTCGTRAFLGFVKDMVYDRIGVRGTIYKEKENKYRLMYFNECDASELLSSIYKNSKDLRLTRKYEKYINNGSPMKETIG